MVFTHLRGAVISASVHKGFPSTCTQGRGIQSHASCVYNFLVGLKGQLNLIIMRRFSFLFVLLLSAVTASAQYVDEEAYVQESYTVQQLVDTMKTLSMRDIINMDNEIDQSSAFWSRENLYAALKQLELKWTGEYDSVTMRVKIRNPRYPQKKVAKFLMRTFFDQTPEYIDSVYKIAVVIGGRKVADPDSVESRYIDPNPFRNSTFKISDLNKKESTFTVTDEYGKKYEFDLGYITDFTPIDYITLTEKQKEDFKKGVKPAEEYTLWDCKSDFGEWYMSIYNNESLRPKLKEMQFISLMTGETVDGLQVEFEDISKNIGGENVIAKNAAFRAVVFPSTRTNGSAYRINREWIPSAEIDFLNNQFVGREVIKPTPQTITKIKRFIVTDKIPEKQKSYAIKFYLAVEMENDDKVTINALSIKEIQDLNLEVPGTTYGDDWYDYKIYNETVLIPAKQRAAKAAKWEKEEAIRAKQRAAKWEKEEAIRAKQRAENLQKYTQKYGEKMAKAIVDGRVIPGMTVDMITEEMGLSYQMLNSSTIIVGSAIGGVMVFEMYKCAVTNGKITMVENIFMKGNY